MEIPKILDQSFCTSFTENARMEAKSRPRSPEIVDLGSDSESSSAPSPVPKHFGTNTMQEPRGHERKYTAPVPKNAVRVSKKIRDLSPKQLQTLWFDRHNEITKLEVGSNKRLEEIPKSLMRMTAEHAVDYVLPNWLFTVTLNTNASSGFHSSSDSYSSTKCDTDSEDGRPDLPVSKGPEPAEAKRETTFCDPGNKLNKPSKCANEGAILTGDSCHPVRYFSPPDGAASAPRITTPYPKPGDTGRCKSPMQRQYKGKRSADELEVEDYGNAPRVKRKAV